MSQRAPVEAQQLFHRYIAILMAVSLPILAIMEIARSDMADPAGPIRWATYLVLAIWALYLVLSPEPNTMTLVITIMAFFGSLSVIEALLDVDVSAFDFATTFGLVMMIGVLVGSLTATSRFVWAAAVALCLSLWSITMGVLRHDSAEVMGVRAVVAAGAVVFTTALVAKLYDELAGAIEAHNRSRRLQDAIARCSEALLVQTDTFAVYEAVRALLEATEADYAYVDRTVEDADGARWEIIADATRRAAVVGGGWRSGSYASIPTAYEALSAGRAVVLHTSDLRGEERRLYEEDGILSEVTVPIEVAGSFRGSIGFIQYGDDRKWTEAEIQTLWRASHMIGAYWRRQEDAAELRASSESKERLLASVSHEIRTPLTAIVGLSEEIISSRTSLGAEELDELNGIIAVQSRELAELVEDLLVASRAEGGTLSIKPENMDLRSEVESVLRVVKESHLTDKAISVAGSGIHAWADPLRVRQILRNLLTNAIKYGGDNVVVSVTGDETARIVVADDGAGVPIHEKDLIFERYYRSAQSPTQPGSVGIGLAVSRQLAEMMDGALVYVASGGEHWFELSLPLISNDVGESGALEGALLG